MWLTVSKENKNSYSWVIEENTGRSNRTGTVTVSSITPPTGSANTVFTQNGATPSFYITSNNPRTVVYNGGTLIMSCETNLASVDILVSESSGARNRMDLSYVGATAEAGISFQSESIEPEKGVTGYRLTFDGDPGASSSFQLFVTYYRTQNTGETSLGGEVYFVSNSVLLTSQSYTQLPNTGSEQEVLNED